MGYETVWSRKPEIMPQAGPIGIASVENRIPPASRWVMSPLTSN
jgi:hypothetical protein